MGYWRLGQLLGRGSMWISDGSEGRVAYGSNVEIDGRRLRNFVGVVEAEGHDEIVRVLRIVERMAVGGFAGLEQERVTLAGDGGGIEAEHQLRLQRSFRAGAVLGCGHEYAGRIEFVAAAGAGLLRVDDECRAHEHSVPGAEVGH